MLLGARSACEPPPISWKREMGGFLMCADFRVKCEVEVRGLTALFLYAAYRRHTISPVPRRGTSAKSSGQHCRERCLAVFPFSVRGAKYHGIHHASRRPTAAPILRVGREGQKSRPRTNKTRGQRGGSETLTYVCYDRNLWELNEKKDASAA